jgi:hypothetical protein
MTAGLTRILGQTSLFGAVPVQDLEAVVAASRLRAFGAARLEPIRLAPRPAQPAQVPAGFRCAAR